MAIRVSTTDLSGYSNFVTHGVSRKQYGLEGSMYRLFWFAGLVASSGLESRGVRALDASSYGADVGCAIQSIVCPHQ